MVCVKCDDAFLIFVNVYVKYKKFRLCCEIFDDIEMTKKEQDKIKKEHINLSKEDKDCNMAGQIYGSDKDLSLMSMDLLSAKAIREADQKILIQERVMNAIAEFRRFMLESAIKVFYSSLGGPEHQKPSSILFSNRHFVLELVQNRFASYLDNTVYVESDEFEKAIKLYFGEPKEPPLSEEDFLKRDKNAYCMHVLFGLFKFRDLLEIFPKEESYDDDGDVSQYLQTAYGVNATFANRSILLSLRLLRQ